MAACVARNCDRASYRNTREGPLCQRHSGNLYKYGHALPLRDFTVRELLDHIGFTTTSNGCQEWNGPLNDGGYGRFTLIRQGHTDSRVHRVVWELHRGPIPDDLEVRHRCDNRKCSALEHLVLGTHLENMGDMVARRRHWLHDRDTCNQGHDLTLPGSTFEYSDGGRCVICRRDRGNKYARRVRGQERAS